MVMVNWFYYGNARSNNKKLEPISSEVALLQPTDPTHPVKLGADGYYRNNNNLL